MIRLEVSLQSALASCLFLILLLGFAPAQAATTQYIYDDLGRLVLVEYPDGSAIAYEYDANGNMVGLDQVRAGGVIINSFSPASGPYGTQVTIVGAGFNTTPAQNEVRFGGTLATVTSASTTELEVTVPTGAPTGPVSVEVGTKSATSDNDFTVLVPDITGFSPAIVNPGDSVSVTGANFNLDPVSTAFSVSGSAVNVLSISDTAATLEAPSASGQIVVNTSYGQDTSDDTLVVVPSWINAADVAGVHTMTLGAGGSLDTGQTGGDAVFEFDAVPGRWLAFKVQTLDTIPAGGYVSYKLYSPTGTIAKSGSTYGPTTISLAPLAAGRYMMVFDPGPTTPLSITASVEQLPDLPIGGPSHSFTGSIQGESAYFGFSATAGDDLSMGLTDVTVTIGSAVHFNVYRPNGAQLTYGTCWASTNPGCMRRLRNLPETGEYAIRVMPASTTGVADYTLTVSQHVDGGTLVAGTPETVAITLPGQIAEAEFTATAGQTVALNMNSITTTPANKYVQLYVFDSSGTQVGTANGTTSGTLNLPDLAADTYTVLVEPGDAATGSVTVELANGLTGTLPADGTSQTFATTVANQNGYFSFAATAGDDLSLGVTDVTVTGSSYVYVTVHRPSGAQMTYAVCYASSNPGCLMKLRNLPETGDYEVRITAAAQAANYTLTLSPHVDGGVLALDTPKTSAVTSPGQIGEFEFSATAGQTATLNMRSITTTPANKTVYFRVYNASGSQIGSAYGTTSATLNMDDLATGTYTVLVEPNNAATGSFTLELASGLTGTLPTDGTSQSFSTAVAGQHGYFTFNATTGDDLSLGVTGLTLSGGSIATIRVYRPSGPQVTYLNCYASASPGCMLKLRNLPETGEYTVTVNPSSTVATADYTLTLSPHVDGGTLALDTPKTVTISIPGQIAELDFTATAGQTVTLDMSSIVTTPSGEYVYVRVYNSAGSQVNWAAGTASATLNLSSLAAGTYTVLVEPSEAATATLQIELQGT